MDPIYNRNDILERIRYANLYTPNLKDCTNEVLLGQLNLSIGALQRVYLDLLYQINKEKKEASQGE